MSDIESDSSSDVELLGIVAGTGDSIKLGEMHYASPSSSIASNLSEDSADSIETNAGKTIAVPKDPLSITTAAAFSKTSNAHVSVPVAFYGCYLLVSCSENPHYKNRTYIGFTVDPNRRLTQHNAGHKAGGARKTDSRGPWKMVLIIHGFPNEISALRFEWAWQKPEESRRLKTLTGCKKQKRESQFDYRLRILAHMLHTGPWNRLPLIIRWLDQSFEREFAPGMAPPLHMRVVYGTIPQELVSKNLHKGGATQQVTHTSDLTPLEDMPSLPCFECMGTIPKDMLCTCGNPDCHAHFHLFCLAACFLREEGRDRVEIIPISGKCPSCKTATLWGDVVALVKRRQRTE